MTFLLVNRHFGGDDVPTGRMLADLAMELKKAGHGVTVLASRSKYGVQQTNRAP